MGLGKGPICFQCVKLSIECMPSDHMQSKACTSCADKKVRYKQPGIPLAPKCWRKQVESDNESEEEREKEKVGPKLKKAQSRLVGGFEWVVEAIKANTKAVMEVHKAFVHCNCWFSQIADLMAQLVELKAKEVWSKEPLKLVNGWDTWGLEEELQDDLLEMKAEDKKMWAEEVAKMQVDNNSSVAGPVWEGEGSQSTV